MLFLLGSPVLIDSPVYVNRWEPADPKPMYKLCTGLFQRLNTECPELEGTHRDHRVQILASPKTIQKLNQQGLILPAVKL